MDRTMLIICLPVAVLAIITRKINTIVFMHAYITFAINKLTVY